ncbi:preprotein translocase subunit SecB [compost metagenome]
MLAAIQLENYYVSRIEMNYTPESDLIENKKVEFSHEVNYDGQVGAAVTIGCSVSDKSGLLIDITMVGYFKIALQKEEDDDKEVEIDVLNDHIHKLCEENTLSILFPYVRSTISDISLKANAEPIILPTINIIALIKKEKEKEKERSRKAKTT